MKTPVWLLLLMVAWPEMPQAAAQPRSGNIPYVQLFTRQLELTEAQRKAWDEIQADQTKAYSNLYRNKELSPQERSKKLAAIREQFEAARRKILSPAQRTQLKELEAARAKQWAEARKPLPERLGFTDKQKNEYEALNKKRNEANMKAYKDYAAKYDAILTEAQKAKRKELAGKQGFRQGNYYEQLGITDAQRKQMRDLQAERSKASREGYEQYRKDLEAIMNKDQRKQYKDLFQRPTTTGSGGRAGVARNWTQLGVYGQLKLSEDQQKRLGAAHQTYSKRSTEIYQNKDLDPKEKRTQMGKAISDYQTAWKKILTPEQQAQYKKLQDENRSKYQQPKEAQPKAPQ